ncbi:MAG: chorismate synthase [Candidatus Riflebacteria bacterium]|nr:chorismate synthase [Candidatus Riflebacteria bacterium]
MGTLRRLTAGESHGKALVGILEGLPRGVPLLESDFSSLMRLRWAGYGRSPRGRIENDDVEILSGVRFGITLGSPLSLLIPNKDYAAWTQAMAAAGPPPEKKTARRLTVPAPGHADLAGAMKYDTRDLRDIRERASARETAMQVALSVPVRNMLTGLGIESLAFVTQLGDIPAKIPANEDIARLRKAVRKTGDEFLTPDMRVTKDWHKAVDKAREDGDTLGGAVEVHFSGVIAGLGSHVQADRRIDGRIAAALMAIPAVRAVEIGAGIMQSRLTGRHAHDAITVRNGKLSRITNLAGGIEGGMTNGEPIVVRAYMKPPPSVEGLPSVDIENRQTLLTKPERSDTVAVAALAVIAESVVAFELASAYLETFGGDTLDDLRATIKRIHKRHAGFF